MLHMLGTEALLRGTSSVSAQTGSGRDCSQTRAKTRQCHMLGHVVVQRQVVRCIIPEDTPSKDTPSKTRGSSIVVAA